MCMLYVCMQVCMFGLEIIVLITSVIFWFMWCIQMFEGFVKFKQFSMNSFALAIGVMWFKVDL